MNADFINYAYATLATVATGAGTLVAKEAISLLHSATHTKNGERLIKYAEQAAVAAEKTLKEVGLNVNIDAISTQANEYIDSILKQKGLSKYFSAEQIEGEIYNASRWIANRNAGYDTVTNASSFAAEAKSAAASVLTSAESSLIPLAANTVYQMASESVKQGSIVSTSQAYSIASSAAAPFVAATKEVASELQAKAYYVSNVLQIVKGALANNGQTTAEELFNLVKKDLSTKFFTIDDTKLAQFVEDAIKEIFNIK